MYDTPNITTLWNLGRAVKILAQMYTSKKNDYSIGTIYSNTEVDHFTSFFSIRGIGFRNYENNIFNIIYINAYGYNIAQLKEYISESAAVELELIDGAINRINEYRDKGLPIIGSLSEYDKDSLIVFFAERKLKIKSSIVGETIIAPYEDNIDVLWQYRSEVRMFWSLINE